MNRRAYLGTVGVVVSASGCSSFTSTLNETETATTTPTQTPTETPTPEPASFDVEIDAPSQIQTGEPWEVSVSVKNTGEKTGSFGTILLIETPSGEFLRRGYINLKIPGGEQKTWDAEYSGFESERNVVFRFEEYDAQAEMTVVPASTKPEVLYANLVSSWEQFGDARDNAIQSASVGEIIDIAFRQKYYLHEGTYHVFEQIDVFDSEDNRVGNQTFTDEQIFEGTGYSEFEHALAFDTQGWGEGTFTARVRVRDEVTGKVSNIVETTFELTS